MISELNLCRELLEERLSTLPDQDGEFGDGDEFGDGENVFDYRG